MTDDPDWQIAGSQVAYFPIETPELLLPGQRGYLRMYEREVDWDISAGYHPDCTIAELVVFRCWVQETVYKVLKAGPDAAGMYRRTVDDGWQLYLTVRSDNELKASGLITDADVVPDSLPDDWT